MPGYRPLYEWGSYSFRNYPLYGPPAVWYDSPLVRAVQTVWAHVARFVDRYRDVEIGGEDVGTYFEY